MERPCSRCGKYLTLHNVSTSLHSSSRIADTSIFILIYSFSNQALYIIFLVILPIPIITLVIVDQDTIEVTPRDPCSLYSSQSTCSSPYTALPSPTSYFNHVTNMDVQSDTSNNGNITSNEIAVGARVSSQLWPLTALRLPLLQWSHTLQQSEVWSLRRCVHACL